MFSDLILIHRSGSTPAAFHTLASESYLSDCLLWKTCLRQIALTSTDTYDTLATYLTPEDQVYEGAEAYRFLLQVVCGLHSPLIGETEVSGQFKNAVTAFLYPATPWGSQMRKLFQVLFEDAKRVRQHHLVDLGSQSYGSVIRREMKDVHDIHIIGAGHLVQEMLPWISKDTSKDGGRVHIHCRNPEKARELLSSQINGVPSIEVHGLNDGEGLLVNAQALIIAAPVTAEWTLDWLERGGAQLGSGQMSLIADTRGDSSEDSITHLMKFSDVKATARSGAKSGAKSKNDAGVDSVGLEHAEREVKVVTLAHLLERISSNQAHVLARKEQALSAIDLAVLERGRYVEYRPFGWEDVCA